MAFYARLHIRGLADTLRDPSIPTGGKCDFFLIVLLNWIGSNQCQDKRDYVYAALGLYSKLALSSNLNFPVDYTKPWQYTFEIFARRLVESSHTLPLLQTIEPWHIHTDLPSWVPDFSNAGPRKDIVRAPFPEHVSEFRSAGESVHLTDRTECQDERKLRVRGCTLSPVSEITLKVQSLVSVEVVGELASGGGPSPTAEEYMFTCFGWFDNAGIEHVLFATATGLRGISRFDVRVGDKLLLLSGCAVPVLARERTDGNYTFMGPARVFGIMRGEAWDSDKTWDDLEVFDFV